MLNPAEEWWAAMATQNDRSAANLLQSEIVGGRHQNSVYELFAEMLEKDAHLFSVVSTRLNGLLGLRRKVLPAPPADEQSRTVAAFVERSLAAIPRFEELLRTLLEGIAHGFSAVELVWSYDRDGRLIVSDWISHPQEWFAFSLRGEFLLKSPPFRAIGAPADVPRHFPAAGRGGIAPAQTFPPPPRKFLVLRFGADFRNPYGRGLCQRAYFLYWLKKNVMKFWAIFNEKYGAPTAVAKYGPGTSVDERQRLRDILEALQTDSIIVIPESIQVELLETQKSGNASSYREFLDWCNDEVSKAVLGATLTSSEGRRSGSLALGSIHQLVRQDYIEADARLLEDVLNGALVRWLCEVNFGADVPVPKLAIETESPQDLNERIRVDRELLALGVALPQSYFYETYGRPAPAPEDTPLRYDDANLYKYHLQFGVLTINEIRQRLNMAPVPWGNVRTTSAVLGKELEEDASEDGGRLPR
jgi:phage gp29-like protein